MKKMSEKEDRKSPGIVQSTNTASVADSRTGSAGSAYTVHFDKNRTDAVHTAVRKETAACVGTLDRPEELDTDTLIEKNMRLVLKIANDFLGRGLPWDDLVSEGNRGLMTAARRYDPERGAKFSTYSALWIKQAIRQAIAEQAQAVRVPIGTQQNARRIQRCVLQLEYKLGRSPSDEEVAEAANLPLVTIQRLRDNRQADMQSLNDIVPGGDQDGTEFQDFFADESTPSPDQALLKLEDIEQLLSLLDTLTERERKVLRLRFGLDGETVLTLEEVGKQLHCTNERVRQIQNQALQKLHDKMLNDEHSD